jgi:hypothetical protein
VPSNSVNCSLRGTWVEVYCYSRHWPRLFPQHGPGKKHQRRIQLAPWQRIYVAREPHRLLRGLVHSDGCRFINTGRRWGYPRYSFTNVSQGIREIFCEACDLIAVHWTWSPPKDDLRVARRRREVPRRIHRPEGLARVQVSGQAAAPAGSP